MIRIAVIADSHFHPDQAHSQSAYASDRQHNARNARVAALVAEARPDAVVHLGDVPHPVPGSSPHGAALAVARRTYQALGAPLYVVPGNHDVGDKPHAGIGAPAAGAHHAHFEATWGPAHQSVDLGDVHLALIDTPILGTGTDREARQRVWLEGDLSAARTRGQRILAFTHYPPFLTEPDEPEHYDNLAPDDRAWLLDVLLRHEVDALFCGHVHHFFWNRARGLDLYLMPSTAFVRPEYSELTPVPPGPEFGRDDTGRLGFAFVHVDAAGHRVEWTHPAPNRRRAPTLAPGRSSPPSTPLGVSPRADWARPIAIPLGNLDDLRRKTARNDLPLQATWELGIRRLRLPAEDLVTAAPRIAALAARGTAITVFSPADAAASPRPPSRRSRACPTGSVGSERSSAASTSRTSRPAAFAQASPPSAPCSNRRAQPASWDGSTIRPTCGPRSERCGPRPTPSASPSPRSSEHPAAARER